MHRMLQIVNSQIVIDVYQGSSLLDRGQIEYLFIFNESEQIVFPYTIIKTYRIMFDGR